jgi:hypothetical protein
MNHRLIALALCFAATTGAAQAGVVIHVANNGLDEAGCGTAASPCRSISAGIAAAADGDTVAVRPGLYGELDNDGALGSPGEETGDYAGVIAMSKRVTVISTGGATVTSIRGIEGRSIVHFTASGAQFGAANAGFTLNRTSGWAIETAPLARGKIAGNILRNVPSGIAVVSSESWEIGDNVIAVTGGQGISIQSASDTTGAVWAHDNVVYGDDYQTGIYVGPRGAHRITDNVVNGPYYGLNVNPGPIRVTRNLVTNTRIALAYVRQYDVTSVTGLPVITRNSFVGNVGSGIFVLNEQTFPLTLRENNIYANGACGIAGNGTTPVDARNNYWGAPTGPSWTNPADPVCDSATPTIRSTPYATSEFPLR